MPAIWNSYSKSDTARRPRRTTLRVLRVHEIHQQRRKARDLDVGERRQHLARHRDALGRR